MLSFSPDASGQENGDLLQDQQTIDSVITPKSEDDFKEIEKLHLSKCCVVNWRLGRLEVRLNPRVSLLSALVIWGLVIWCMVQPNEAEEIFQASTAWITDTWTWLYIVTKDVGLVFFIVVLCSKYSRLRLGRDTDRPEFSDLTYFTMLFACGIGIGIFYFSVAETITHYEPGPQSNRYYNRYSDNQRAQDALNLTLFHWGIHGWAAYNFVGLAVAFLSHRMGLPMTMRSCLHPVLGSRIFGWMGDLVDLLSVICTVFAASTSLGLGVIQLNSGLFRLNENLTMSTGTQIIIIWVVTAIATTSVISGLRVGIKLLSQLCLGLGMFILLVVLFTDNTWYLGNLFVQSVGYYLQNFIGLGFHTDAFAQEGNAPDGKQTPDWMNNWTIFYWGWWVAYAPSVGLFTAKISKGRTVGEFIRFTMSVPVVYTFLWMCVFGGVGLRMEREAALNNVTCDSVLGGRNSTEPYNGLYRLSCRTSDQMWFDVVGSYPGTGFLLSVLSLASIVLYFVTTSDSASLVTDSLASNGIQDTPVWQRVFWALTQGACATALLTAGGTHALLALQAASVAAGLPFTFVICFFYVALWRAFKLESRSISIEEGRFHIDLLGTLSNCRLGFKCLMALVAPWYYLANSKSRLHNNTTQKLLVMLALAAMLYLTVVLLVLESVVTNMAYVGLAVYVGFASCVASIRHEVRTHCDVIGNAVEDFFAGLLMYPCVAVQLDDHTSRHETMTREQSKRGKESNL